MIDIDIVIESTREIIANLSSLLTINKAQTADGHFYRRFFDDLKFSELYFHFQSLRDGQQAQARLSVRSLEARKRKGTERSGLIVHKQTNFSCQIAQFEIIIV